MTRYSLWRGPALLGHFTERIPVDHHGKVAGAAGILERIPGSSLQPMMQTRFPQMPGAPVLQHQFEPFDPGAARSEPHLSLRKEISYTPLDEEAAEVPEQARFRVLDESGRDVDADMIWIQQMLIPPDADPAELPEGVLVGSDRSIWHVAFSRM